MQILNVFYADLESLIFQKINGCRNNPENPSRTKVSEHIPSGVSMSTTSSFKSLENKYDKYIIKRFVKPNRCKLIHN